MKNLVSLFLLLFIALISSGQNYQWAYTTAKPSRSTAVAIRQDLQGNFYLATYTDSLTTRLYSEIEKYDAGQQVIWQRQLTGNVTIADVEINSANHAIVTGYFDGTMTIDSNTITSGSGVSIGFIFESDENGLVLWLQALNPVTDGFKPVDLFLAPGGEIYLTSELSGASLGFCAFHKLDANGNILKSEFNNNYNNRTFSHIVADSSGNVYLSGTCSNFASFDSLSSDSALTYQNFLVKYDSTFNAQWLITRNYGTFDHNNKLVAHDQNLYWVFDDFTNISNDTLKIIKTDQNGQIISSVNGPLPFAFFSGIDFSMDRFGNSTLIMETFSSLFVYRFDNAFNIIWQDTIATQISGFTSPSNLICYDSCFYLTSEYVNDTLILDNFTLLNPNIGTNFPSDIFVCKWGYGPSTSGLETVQDVGSILLYPNPASNQLHLNIADGSLVTISDAMGKIILCAPYSGSLNVSLFANGIYYLRTMGKHTTATTRLVINH